MRVRKPKDTEVLCHRAKQCPKKKRSRLAPWLLSQTAVMAPISFSYFATFFSDVTIQPEFLRHSKRSFFFFSVLLLLFGREKVVPTVVTFPRAYRTSAICRRLLLFGKRRKERQCQQLTSYGCCLMFLAGQMMMMMTVILCDDCAVKSVSLSLSLSLYITVHYPAAISTLIVKSYIAAGRGDTLLSLLCSSRLDGRDSPTGRQESQ